MIDTESSTASKPLRRTVLLENHFGLICKLVNKSYNGLPMQLRAQTTADDIFQSAIVHLRKQMINYDARKAAPSTFITTSVTRYLQRLFQYRTRQCRFTEEVVFDVTLHNRTTKPDTDLEDFDVFLLVCHRAPKELRARIQDWLTEGRTVIAGDGEYYKDFRILAEHYGLSPTMFRRVLNNEDVRNAIRETMEVWN